MNAISHQPSVSSSVWNWIRETFSFLFRCTCHSIEHEINIIVSVSLRSKLNKILGGFSFCYCWLLQNIHTIQFAMHVEWQWHKVNFNNARTKLSPVNVLIEFHFFIQAKATSINHTASIAYEWAARLFL